jgi:CBS-domain-containing membrane protein
MGSYDKITHMGSKIQEYLKKAEDIVDVAVNALDLISKMTKNVADDKAADVLRAVSAMVETAKAGVKGDVTPSEAKAALLDLQEKILDVNNRIDKMIHDKFDVGGK